MDKLEKRYEVTNKDLVKDKALKYGAALSPVLLSTIPAGILFVLGFLFGTTPPVAATFFFLSFISLIGGFFVGLGGTGGLLYYRSKWLSDMREKIAIDGIKASEVDWFKNELTTTEKKALKEVESRNLLLADAYRDTLAARLTATRIKKATNRELLIAKRRQNKLKYLKSANSEELTTEINKDVEKLQNIKKEAEDMKIEAETRLEMIEAAARRGTDFVDTELQLKKLSARTSELPLALEAAKKTAELEAEIRKELEAETDKVL